MIVLNGEDLKEQLTKLISSRLEEPYSEICKSSSSVGLTLREFAEKLSDVIFGFFNRSELEEIVKEQQFDAIDGFIASLQLEDLLLAVACSRGYNPAWEKFMKLYKDFITRTAYYFCKSADSAQELAESIMAELFIPRSNGPTASNKLSTYNGRGSLQGWLRVVISRASIDMIRAANRLVQLDPDSRALQKHAFIKPDFNWDQKYIKEAENALKPILQQLPAKDKLLLGFYYYHHLSLNEIALYFKVHEATISRWLDKTRKKIKKSVEKVLKKDLGLKDAQLKQLWTTSLDQITLDLESYLKQDDL